MMSISFVTHWGARVKKNQPLIYTRGNFTEIVKIVQNIVTIVLTTVKILRVLLNPRSLAGLCLGSMPAKQMDGYSGGCACIGGLIRGLARGL